METQSSGANVDPVAGGSDLLDSGIGGKRLRLCAVAPRGGAGPAGLSSRIGVNAGIDSGTVRHPGVNPGVGRLGGRGREDEAG